MGNFKFKSSLKIFLQKLTKGIIIPIILLSFAGLFLGFGNELAKYTDFSIASNVLISIGDILFSNLGLLFAIAIAITFTNNAGIAGFSAFVGWIVFIAFQVPFIDSSIEESTIDILFYNDLSNGLVTTNMGLNSLKTSLFGGVIIGFSVSLIYKMFHNVKLPTVLCFFSGTRLVPIATFLLIPFISMTFLLIYPLLGIWIDKLAYSLTNLTNELGLFLFGTIDKLLMPLGLSDVFEKSLWSYSNSNVEGFYSLINPLMKEVENKNNLQGNYFVAIFALPAAGLAMIMATKNNNRRIIFSTITLAIIVSFLTGITEPLEFFILFWAPFLYFGFHIWMSGFSFLLIYFLNGNVEMSIYGGIIDFIYYGVISIVNEKEIIIWQIFSFAILYSLFYFFVFYFIISKFKLQLVEEGMNNIYQIKKDFFDVDNLKARGIDPRTGVEFKRSKKVEGIVKNLGGFNNIKTIDACFTRLRLTIRDKNKINEENLKALGAIAVIIFGEKSVQIIFGKEAERIKDDLLTYNKYIEELIKFKKEQKK